MNPKVRKISYKLYLTVQAFVVLIGAGVLVWNLIAGAHDLYISSKGRECAWSAVGPELLKPFENDDSKRWTSLIEKYSESFDHPAKKYALKDLLERSCSDFLRVSIYTYTEKSDLDVYTNNYIDGYPATFKERAGYVALTIGVTLFFLGLFFGAMKWITWLLRD